MIARLKSIFTRTFEGFSAYRQGLRLIHEHKLYPYIILPSTVSLFSGLFVLAATYYVSASIFLGFVGWVVDGVGSSLPGSFQTGAVVLARIGAVVLAIFLYVILYRAIAAVAVMPFMGPLLNQLEIILVGKPIVVTFWTDVKNALKGIWIGFRYAVLGLFTLVFTIPLGPFQFLILVPVQAYLMGRSIFDYLLEKEAATFKERRKIAEPFRPEILGLGMAYFLVTLIPILGAFIGPVAALAGAAKIYYGKRQAAAT